MAGSPAHRAGLLLRRRGAPRLRDRARAGGLAGDFLAQPVEAGEIVAEAALGVLVGVVEDADGAAPTAVADRGEKRGVEFTLGERDDFLAGLVAAGDGAVEVEREQVRLHLREECGEAGEVGVAVVQIVDEADVGDALGAQVRDDFELVLGFAEPRNRSAM